MVPFSFTRSGTLLEVKSGTLTNEGNGNYKHEVYRHINASSASINVDSGRFRCIQQVLRSVGFSDYQL